MPFEFHIDILDIIFKGLIIGVLCSAPMGPVGILCVQRTLNKGRWYGFVTGIGFYLNAKAIPMVPFNMVAVLQSTMVFFSIAWGALFFHEPITGWILAGTVMFVLGIIFMQHSKKQSAA